MAAQGMYRAAQETQGAAPEMYRGTLQLYNAAAGTQSSAQGLYIGEAGMYRGGACPD